MKIVTVLLIFGVAFASADFFDHLQSLKIIKEGKHEELIKKIRSSKVEITEEMFISALKTVHDHLLTPQPNLDIDPADLECGMTFLAIINALQAGQLWPLFMLDPWAKIQSGFTAGNIRNTGHFLQCINGINLPIDSPANDMKGRHCTVGIRGFIESDYEFPGGIQPPPPIVDLGEVWPHPLFLDFGVCFPAICREIIVDTVFRIILAYLGLEPTPLFTNNREAFCSIAENPPLGAMEIGALVLIGLGFGGIILATVYEFICIKMKVVPNEITAAMSAISNGRYLFSLRKKKDHIQSLHGLRALALIWLILGYRFLLPMVLPTVNPLDYIFNFTDGIFSTIVYSFHLSFDTLLFLNATLITFLFMNKMDRTGRVRVWKMYIYRFMRISPFIAIVIFFLFTLTKYSESGPYYTFLTEAQNPNCEKYWWSALLHVQNYVNPDEICVLHTFLFSVDMQLYWVSPLILFPLFYLGGWVLIFIALVISLSIACAATVSYFYGFQAFFLNMLLEPSKMFDYLRMVFFATHVRMGPWFIGMIIGYLCYRIKKSNYKFSFIISACLWILSISGVIAVILLMHPFHQILENDTSDAANYMYIGFARNIFTLCLGWFVIGCFTGSGSIVNWILSLSIWMPLSRMSISVYIVSLSAQMVIIASQKEPTVFGGTEFMHGFHGDIVLITLFSTMTFLMIERPICRLVNFLFKIGTTKTNEKEGINGGPEHELTFEQVKPWKSFY